MDPDDDRRPEVPGDTARHVDEVVRDDEQRLDDLEEEIEHARKVAEQLIDRHEHRFADSDQVDTADDGHPHKAPPA